LSDVDEWLRLPTRLWDDLRASPQTWFFFVVAYGAYAWSLGRLRGAITHAGDAARRCYASGFLPTLKVLLLTVVCSFPAPALLWFLSSRLTAWPGTTEFVRAFASGMKTTAVVWLSVALVRQALRRKGLADAHFGYSSTACDAARRILWRLAAVGIPATFIAATCESLGVVPVEASIGRAAFILGMLCLCRSMHVVTHPERGLLQNSRDDEDKAFQDKDDFRLRLRRMWHLGACAAPLGCAALSAAGYHYTALQLTVRLQTTVWLLLGFALGRSLLLRALMTARHRLILEQARQPKSANCDAPGAVGVGPTLTLSVIDRQSRRLVNGFGALALALGVWFVWVDMLPALKFLDRWQLYSYAVTTTDAPAATGDAPPKAVDVTRWEWITAADLASAAIILLMAFIAARNLPGLLEITCLQWLPIDSGARYAATTVARYVIHLATIIAVCNVIGLQWSNIQWLAAAATVGLGFGLQEIFANFISGLIILFERPIRVGDTVTIRDVTGTVSRIRSRATTIVDGDRKELIVPNKEFITGQLMNWTLSDDVLRTVLRVGVNHDADVQRAARLLTAVAEANPLVLRDPEPSVACTQLGDQHLEIELRVFSSGTASLSPLRHQLNVAVLQAFHEAGIMLASPPRELVLRSLDALRPMSPADERKAA
jgi:potassium efflux system protein